MQPLDFDRVRDFVNKNIVIFHQNKINKISKLKLNDILKRKNPYLFRVKNLGKASDLITEILDAYLYASEEKMFGDFLEDLAIYISEMTMDGRKSSSTGIDLEFDKDRTRFLVSIKSGPHWGNVSQKTRLSQDFEKAQRTLRQSKHIKNIEPILGICYGKAKKTFIKNYTKLEGQEFWQFISGNKNLYIDIIEPLGHQAKKHNDDFLNKKNEVNNLFVSQFIKNYCSPTGAIDWEKLVRFNSGNLENGPF